MRNHALVTREQVIRELRIPLTTVSLALQGLKPWPVRIPTNEPRLYDTEAVREALAAVFAERRDRYLGKAKRWDDEVKRVMKWRT